MSSVSGEGSTNGGSNATRHGKGKLFRQILLKIGMGLLAHETIEELDDVIDDVSELARDAMEESGEDAAD